MSLEEEVKRFQQEKTLESNDPRDRTAMRFYFGNALAGLLANANLGYVRPAEIIQEALSYARMAVKKEEEF